MPKARGFSSRGWRERGAAAVEMAIVLPMLLLIVGGLVDLGRAYYTNLIITNAAREGARMVAMGYTTAQADNRITQAAIGLGGMTMTRSYSTCPSAGGNGTATVTITNFSWLMLDVVPSFFGGSIPLPNLSATGSMRCNG
jgi:Flp pilus assembly protein TadG